MIEHRTLGWFSCGAASAVAVKLSGALPVYCETGSEHPDNERFMADCEQWFGQKVTRLRSNQYTDTWDVWHKERWLAGIKGAKCTTVLKVIPRLEFQRPGDLHVFGYTFDSRDMERARMLSENFPELTLVFPLIEREISKAACLAMVQRAGIALPPMYAMGFQNNNCIPCVKATIGRWCARASRPSSSVWRSCHAISTCASAGLKASADSSTKSRSTTRQQTQFSQPVTFSVTWPKRRWPHEMAYLLDLRTHLDRKGQARGRLLCALWRMGIRSVTAVAAVDCGNNTNEGPASAGFNSAMRKPTGRIALRPLDPPHYC